MDEVFYDARGTSKIYTNNNVLNSNLLQDESEQIDPPTREVLPVLKDPNFKISTWALIKDLIGQDLTKISFPVYLNDPLSML